MYASEQPILCIGSALWDIIASSGVKLEVGSDVPGLIRRRPGGVALNIALALAASGQKVALLATIGHDTQGDALIVELETAGVICDYVTRTDDPTDTYLAIENPDGEVFAAIADCASLEKAGETVLNPLRDGRLANTTSPWTGSVIIDGNLPVSVLNSITDQNDLAQAQLTFVPASPGKADRMRAALKSQIGTLFVNRGEAEILCQRPFVTSKAAAIELIRLGATRAIVTDGPKAASLCTSGETICITPPPVEAITTTGAGDVFLAGFIAAELSRSSEEDSMLAALAAAAMHITKEVR